MRIHSYFFSRRITRVALGIGLSLIGTASLVHAHGGMASPDELGPPLFTSAALAFVCYWVVVLWPSSKRNDSDDSPGKENLPASGRQRSMRATSKVAGPRPPSSELRKVQNSVRRSGLEARRKANDV
jgi:hypothetical protein